MGEESVFHPTVLTVIALFRFGRAAGIAFVFLGAQAKAQQFSDDFNDGNDNGWSHLEPLGSFGSPGVFSFPAGGIKVLAGLSIVKERSGPGTWPATNWRPM
jgi:hypothetical protein